jgi:hypothetical protein
LEEFEYGNHSADSFLKEGSSQSLQQLQVLKEMIPIIAFEENRFITDSENVSACNC